MVSTSFNHYSLYWFLIFRLSLNREVKGKKIVDLSKEGVDIIKYKNTLVSNSKALIEKAKLVSKKGQKVSA